MGATNKERIPLFQLYTLEELEAALPYSGMYLLSIRDRLREPNPRFIKVVCWALNKSEEELFGPKVGSGGK